MILATQLFLVAAFLLSLPITIAFLRILLGPTIADRVIAIDATTCMVVSAFILLAVYYKQSFFVDIAIVYTLLSFGSTIYFAKYLVKK
ncbi:MAG: monovalent cation/H+ antiporter complex subunit F [Candidatus Diapherotrites archaeon]